MGAITEIFRAVGPEYLERFPDMPLDHKKTIEAIINCRSGEFGQVVYQCEECGQKHSVDRSCGNRHCPQCQYHKSRRPPRTSIFRSRASPRSSGGKFKAEMVRRKLINSIDPAVWKIDWNVNSQAVGDGEASYKYLAPYIFRVAIADSRIVGVKDGDVTFTYRKQESNRPRRTTVDTIEFIRRFLQPVLPTGFMKVRHYGFMSSSCPISRSKLRLMVLSVVATLQGEKVSLTDLAPPKDAKPPMPKPKCRLCGGVLLYLFSLIPGRPCRGNSLSPQTPTRGNGVVRSKSSFRAQSGAR